MSLLTKNIGYYVPVIGRRGDNALKEVDKWRKTLEKEGINAYLFYGIVGGIPRAELSILTKEVSNAQTYIKLLELEI